MDIMTLEEFTECVKAEFTPLRVLPKEKIDAYFETDETKEMVRDAYEDGIEDLEAGEITEEVFRIGRIGSIAHCLALMY